MSMVRLSQPCAAMTSAAKPCGSCNQPLTAAPPSCQICLSRFGRILSSPSGMSAARNLAQVRRAGKALGLPIGAGGGKKGGAEVRSMDDLARMRQEYGERGLRKADVVADPLEQFARWFEEARAAPILEPNGMTLATVDASGQPSARTVLLKGIDRRGLAFYTNLESRKARELAAIPKAALLFWWPAQGRQVRFEGVIERVDDAEADAHCA